MRKTAILIVLAAFTALAGKTPENFNPSNPVLVRFENLYWVGAKSGLPHVVAGQIMAPAEETCDLLGLPCILTEQEARISTQTTGVPLTQGADDVAWLPLARLAKQAGLGVSWDTASKTATLTGGSGSKGWRSALDYVGQPQNVYAGPLQTARAAPKFGQPSVTQTIIATVPLQDLTYFSKTASSLNIVGAQVPSTPDVPNRFPGCGGKTTCSLPVPRDALWVLALVTAK